jgi:outer membrane protein TolC
MLNKLKLKKKYLIDGTFNNFHLQGFQGSNLLLTHSKFRTRVKSRFDPCPERNLSDRAPDQQTARVGLSVTQSLLRGFGPAVNLVSVRQAELDAAASIYELRGFTETLLADSEAAYWNFVLAEQEIAIFERSLLVVKQQRDEIEQKIDVGVLPKTEAAAARAQVAVHEQALIDARSLLEERRLKLLRKISIGAAGHLDRDVNAVSDPFVHLSLSMICRIASCWPLNHGRI